MEWQAALLLFFPRSFMTCTIGIDVSKATLAIAERTCDAETKYSVRNTPRGIALLCNKYKQTDSRFILESTGRFHILPAYLLSQKGYDVRVVNPLAAKRYVQASIRKRKTDPTDASALAHMGAVDQKLPQPFMQDKRDIRIRNMMGLLSTLERQIQSLNRTLSSYTDFQEQFQMQTSEAEENLTKTVKTLEREKERLAEDIQRRIAADETCKDSIDLACTIPGISPLTGSLLCHLLDTTCKHPKQWIAFVGFDVAEKASGMWKGRGKLSKRGNAYLRKRLFSAAWGAVMNDQQFKDYYDSLKEQGHSHREALVIIARKLLRILFMVLKNQTPFSPEKCLFS